METLTQIILFQETNEVLNNSNLSTKQDILPIRMDVVNDLSKCQDDHKSLDFAFKKSFNSFINNLSCVHQKFDDEPLIKPQNVITSPELVSEMLDSKIHRDSWAKITRGEEVKLRQAPWYQPGLSRYVIQNLLQNGAFQNQGLPHTLFGLIDLLYTDV